MQFAAALSRGSVSLILFVVRADTRIACVVAKVQEFLTQFIDFEANIAVCMTHMDKVGWSERSALDQIKSACSIEMVMCTWVSTPGLQAHCAKRTDFGCFSLLRLKNSVHTNGHEGHQPG